VTMISRKVWRLAEGMVPPGGNVLTTILKGAWHLAACGFR